MSMQITSKTELKGTRLLWTDEEHEWSVIPKMTIHVSFTVYKPNC